jgi:hypothetical protein
MLEVDPVTTRPSDRVILGNRSSRRGERCEDPITLSVTSTVSLRGITGRADERVKKGVSEVLGVKNTARNLKIVVS